MNEWRFEICPKVGADESRVGTIIDALREQDREEGRQRLGEPSGGCWPFEFGETALEQEDARGEVEKELTLMGDDVLDVLDARPAE